MLPVRYAPKSSPSTVMIGISALRSAWRTDDDALAQPLRARRAHEVARRATSSIAERVMRARNAIERMPSASAGSTRYRSPPKPDGGSQCSVTAKSRMSSRPTQ